MSVLRESSEPVVRVVPSRKNSRGLRHGVRALTGAPLSARFRALPQRASWKTALFHQVPVRQGVNTTLVRKGNSRREM